MYFIYFYINYNPYTTTISYSILKYLITANAHFATQNSLFRLLCLRKDSRALLLSLKSCT